MSNDIARAEHAKRLVSDALLVEILDAVEQDAVDAWTMTDMGAIEQREMAYQNFKASRRIRDKLKGVMDNGLVAAARDARS